MIKLVVFFLTYIYNLNAYLSSNPSWISNPYFKSGYQQLVTSTLPANSSLTFKINFSSSMSSPPKIVYGIKNWYSSEDIIAEYNFDFGKINITSSYFYLYLTTGRLTLPCSVTIVYFLIDSTYPYHINSFDNFPLNKSSGDFPTNVTVLSNLKFIFNETINYTQQAIAAGYSFRKFKTPLTSNNIALFLNRYVGGGTTGLPNMTMATAILNETHYNLTLYKAKGIYYYNISLCSIIFDSDNVLSSGNHMAIYEFWTAPIEGIYFDFSKQVNSSVIIGFIGYTSVNFVTILCYNWNFYTNYSTNSSFGIKFDESIGNTYSIFGGLNTTASSVFYVNTWVCPPSYSIFNVTSQLCQDQCNDYYYTNLTNKLCYNCHYSCAKCSAPLSTYDTCLSCLSFDQRILLNGTCVCQLGYFDNGYSHNCQSCNTIDNGAMACTFALNYSQSTSFYANLFNSTLFPSNVLSLYISTSCKTAYYLNSTLKQCILCTLSNCLKCINSTACLTCNTSNSYVLYPTNNLCYFCSISNCLICNSTNICSTCQSGFDLISNACQQIVCSTSCTCNGFYLPIINGSCSTICGDALKVGNQQCDDGNTISHDGCSSNCKIQFCSENCSCQGYIFPLVNNLCSTICGDGFKVGLEQCDDGNIINHDGCNSACKIQSCSQSCLCQGYVLPLINNACSTICGDGFVSGTEQCDDNNTISHDGCSSICKIQNCSEGCGCSGYYWPYVNGSCKTICGDNYKAGLEQCDDGNIISHDGCSSVCLIENCDQSCLCDGWHSPYINGSCSVLCGDGIKQGGQQCDDGNVINGDGCSSSCLNQLCNVSCLCQGYYLPKISGMCTIVCGDGYKAGLQQCDDGNIISHDGCSSVCLIENCDQSCLCDGWHLPYINGSCSVLCGDGIKQGGQQCDDGNVINGDGCSSSCLNQLCNVSCLCQGYYLPKISGMCTIVCGDGYKTSLQQCDDGNIINHDGCSSVCLIENCDQSCLCDGWHTPYINGSCSVLCGDGVMQGSEQCDDGNTVNYDGCSINCKIQTCEQSCLCLGWKYSQVNNSCQSICGDGIIILGRQQCDDGNIVSNDGCSNLCKLENINNSFNDTQSIIEQRSSFISVQSSKYLTLGLFLIFGFRISGMESLFIIQNFQLILEVEQIKTIQISQNIHGYTDFHNFPNIFQLDNQIFNHFNFMLIGISGIITLCILLQLLGYCFKQNPQNQILNSSNSVAPPSLSRSKILGLEKSTNLKTTQSYQNDGSEASVHQVMNFRVHYNPKTTNIITSDFNTIPNKANSLGKNQPQQKKQLSNQPLLTKLSRFIFFQILFDLMIDCISILSYAFVEQIIDAGLSSILNIQIIIIAGLFLGLLTLLLINCLFENDRFGQNQSKFSTKSKCIIYWGITIGQRIVYSALIGSKIPAYLYIIVGLKLCVLSGFSFVKTIFHHSTQKFRNLFSQILHLCLLGVFTLNKYYLSSNHTLASINKYLQVQFIYYAIMILLMLISFGFMFTQILNTLQFHFQSLIEGNKQNLGKSSKTINLTNNTDNLNFCGTNDNNIKQENDRKHIYSKSRIMTNRNINSTINKNKNTIPLKPSPISEDFMKNQTQMQKQLNYVKKNGKTKNIIKFQNQINQNKILQSSQNLQSKLKQSFTNHHNLQVNQLRSRRDERITDREQMRQTRAKSFMKSNRRLNNRYHKKDNNFEQYQNNQDLGFNNVLDYRKDRIKTNKGQRFNTIKRIQYKDNDTQNDDMISITFQLNK